jgi:hypothetical protein
MAGIQIAWYLVLKEYGLKQKFISLADPACMKANPLTPTFFLALP